MTTHTNTRTATSPEAGTATNLSPDAAAAAQVTGIGVIAPNGLGTEAYWQATLEGRSGISRITRFDPDRYPTKLAGQITGFDPAEHLPARLLPQTDISTKFALTAAAWALADAAVGATADGAAGAAAGTTTTMTGYDMGVVTGNALGGFEFTHQQFRNLWAKGPQHVSVYESFAWFYAVNTGQISIRHGMQGPSRALAASQACGLDAVGHARRTIRAGTAAMMAGGTDSALDPWGWVSHLASGQISQNPDPKRAYQPFSANASGHLPGEGGALLVLEHPAAAAARGAQPYGQITGYAATFDPAPGSPRPPGLRRCAELAIADAGLTPAHIDVVFADASGVPHLDRLEAQTIRDLFGPYAVPVTAPKALTGRLHAGSGPLDLATALLAIRDGIIPATPATTPHPDDQIDLVHGEPRPAKLRTALILARGQWGFNSAIVATATPPPHPR